MPREGNGGLPSSVVKTVYGEEENCGARAVPCAKDIGDGGS